MDNKKLLNRIQILLFLGILGLVNCTSKTPPTEYFNQMFDSPAREAQEEDYFAENRSAGRIPPFGAIPVGYNPYPYIEVMNPDDLEDRKSVV